MDQLLPVLAKFHGWLESGSLQLPSLLVKDFKPGSGTKEGSEDSGVFEWDEESDARKNTGDLQSCIISLRFASC